VAGLRERAAHLAGLRNARRDRRAAARREAELAARDARLLASLRGRTDLRLNVGSSGTHVEGWLSLDLLRDPEGRCIVMDATRPWPFDDGAAEAITTEHVVEHIAPEAVPAVLAEAFRVLRPGGVLRTSTPDLEGLARALLARDPAVLAAHREHGYEARTHGDLFNNYAYLWGHVHLWDLDSLRLRLEDAGFAEVERAAYGESRHPVLRGVDRHDPRPLQELVLWVDAVRPMAAT